MTKVLSASLLLIALSLSANAQDVTVTGTGTLSTTGVTAGSCGDSSHSCGLTIDAKGRITAQSNNPVTAAPGGTDGQFQINAAGALDGVNISGGDGSVSSTGFMSVTGTGGLPFAPTATVDGTNATNITSGTLSGARLENIITSGGPLGSSTTVPQITWDSHGRITAINSVAIAANGTVTSIICPQEATITTTGVCSEAHPGYIVGRWYPPMKMAPSVTGSELVNANTIKCAYGSVPIELTITTVGAHVGTAAAGGNFQWALYSNTNHRPGSFLANTGNISTGSATDVSGTLNNSTQVGPNGYGTDIWWCFNADNNTAIFRSLDGTSADPSGSEMVGGTSIANALGNSARTIGISCAGANCAGGSSTYGTWPSSLFGSTWSDVINKSLPAPAFQVSSVP